MTDTEPAPAPEPFTPTHVLRFEQPAGGLVEMPVQLHQGDLYTEAEWKYAVQPRWSIHAEYGEPMYSCFFARDCFRRVSLRTIEDQ